MCWMMLLEHDARRNRNSHCFDLSFYLCEARTASEAHTDGEWQQNKKISTLVSSATMTQRNSFNLETAPLKLAVIYSRCDAPLRGG